MENQGIESLSDLHKKKPRIWIQKLWPHKLYTRSVAQSYHIRFFATPWTVAHQAPKLYMLHFTIPKEFLSNSGHSV